MEKGFLGVSTFAAGRILPISDAFVYVSQNDNGKEELLYSLLTDENGNIKPLDAFNIIIGD